MGTMSAFVHVEGLPLTEFSLARDHVHEERHHVAGNAQANAPHDINRASAIVTPGALDLCHGPSHPHRPKHTTSREKASGMSQRPPALAGQILIGR